MSNQFNSDLDMGLDPVLALQEIYPDETQVESVIADRHMALQAYLAYEGGLFDDVPAAFEAHVHSRQFNID